MEYKEVKEWLDAIVDTIERQRELVFFNASIETHEPNDYYFIYRGIEIVADLMGMPLNHTVDEDKKHPHTYSFVYRDIKFLQLEREPLEGVAHEDV